MNRIILISADNPTNLTEETFVLHKGDPRYEHLTQHLKLSEGARLNITVLDRGLGKGTITKLSSETATIEIDEELEKGEERFLHLFVAYSRPPTLKKILEHGVGFPVKTLTFFHAELAEKSFSTSKVLHPDEQKRHLLAGLSQSGVYDDLPEVTVSDDDLAKTLKTLGEHPTYHLDRGPELNFAHVGKKRGPLNLFIGPERGWTGGERKLFADRDIRAINISKSILRVEMAFFVSLGQLELLQSLQRT